MVEIPDLEERISGSKTERYPKVGETQKGEMVPIKTPSRPKKKEMVENLNCHLKYPKNLNVDNYPKNFLQYWYYLWSNSPPEGNYWEKKIDFQGKKHREICNICG